MNELKKEIQNCRMLKNTGSWLYCGRCGNTVGYLCYSTYQSFQFGFTCKCGNSGSFDLQYAAAETVEDSVAELAQRRNRLCCPHDNAPLFTVVEKNIENYSYSVTCKHCSSRFAKRKARNT